MAELLRGCRAKIERAHECVKNLNTEIDGFLSADPPPYTIARELEKNSRDYVFIVRATKSVPDRFAVLAGEVVHHLASSLDYLFGALVTRAGNAVEKTHYFPIYTKTREFRIACDKGAISHISPAAQKLVRLVQPCFTPTPRDTVLAAVKELNNIDKHRLLLVLLAAGRLGDNIRIGREDEVMVDIHGQPPRIVGFGDASMVEVTKDGEEFFRIKLAAPTPKFEANAEFAAQVVFAQCGLTKLVPIADALPAMVAGVTHTINLFREEFALDD